MWCIKQSKKSQSLWNRAGSFDFSVLITVRKIQRLNPFGTGQGLSTEEEKASLKNALRLNPFGTGQGLSTIIAKMLSSILKGLNPFGTGQGLSTLVCVEN